MVITNKTRLIEPSTQSYPVFLSQVRGRFPHISFPAEPSRSSMVKLGFYPVLPEPKPEGDVVKEGAPVFSSDGDYHQSWSSRDYTEAERLTQLNQKKQRLRNAANTLRDKELSTGVKYVFPNGSEETIPLQQDDQTILVTRRMLATEALMAGVEQEFVYRTVENNVHLLTPQQMVDMTNYVLQHHEQLMVNSWAYKDAVADCETIESLPEPPVTFAPSQE